MVNMWLVHVKNTRKLLPKGTMFKNVLKAAKKTWKKAKGTTAKEILPNKNRSFSLLLKSYGDVGKLKKEH